MSLHLLDLRPIKGFAPAEKVNLPVSIALLPDGTPHVVSRYSDAVWDFYPYIPQENMRPSAKQIDWRISLPDGHRLTDPEHAGLLESAKDFIWSLFAQPVEGRKRLTMVTLIRKREDLRPLLCWMVSLGLTRFAGLEGRTLDYVPVSKLGQNGKSVAAMTATTRLLVVEDLYHQRDKLDDTLTFHPWPFDSACSLAGLKVGGAHANPKTGPIPDAVAGRLAEMALDYVQNRSPAILAAATARNAGYQGSGDLMTETIRLRTACYIVIDMFSGIRDSEMMSIAENCITPGKSKDGSADILWLHGTINERGPKR